jgi:recombination protein RecT
MARNTIQKQANALQEKKNSGQPSLNQQLNSFLDGEKLRGRFDELLGKRAPQFVSSMVSLINANDNLQKAFYETPMSVIQSCLKAASFDLPIDQNLGYAYIVPFKNKGRHEAPFILGWKGMHQLALRTGVYKVINVLDVRQGELKSYNRLTEEIELDFIDDEDERESLPIIGYVGYYRLINGTEKTIYMSKKKIEAHERKHRKGDYMGWGWKNDWDAMARKTVYRQLIGKWGVMSIDYRSSGEAQQLAQQMSDEDFWNQDTSDTVPTGSVLDVDPDTGEVMNGANIDQYGDEYGPELTGGA